MARRIGRKPRISKKIIGEIVDARALGSPLRVAAGYAGIGESTLHLWMDEARILLEKLQDDSTREETLAELVRLQKSEDKDERSDYRVAILKLELLERLDQALAYAAISWLQVIDRAASIDPKWASYMLEKNFPEEFGNVQRTELTGKDGAPVLIEDLSNLSVEERAARVQNLLTLAASRRDGTAEDDPASD